MRQTDQDMLCHVSPLANPKYALYKPLGKDMRPLIRLEKEGYVVQREDKVWVATEKGDKLVSEWMNADA